MLADQAQHNLYSFALTVFLCLLGGSGVFGLLFYAFTCLSGVRRSEINVTGTINHNVSGRIEHEHSGTVRQVVEHSGTVQHVHQLDEADRARLDRMTAQREMEAAERARLERVELSRKLDEIERQRPYVIDAQPARRALP